MKKQFIPVEVADELPEKEGQYIVQYADNLKTISFYENGKWFDYYSPDLEIDVDLWYKEVESHPATPGKSAKEILLKHVHHFKEDQMETAVLKAMQEYATEQNAELKKQLEEYKAMCQKFYDACEYNNPHEALTCMEEYEQLKAKWE